MLCELSWEVVMMCLMRDENEMKERKGNEMIERCERGFKETHSLCDSINSKNSFGNLIKGRTGVGI